MSNNLTIFFGNTWASTYNSENYKQESGKKHPVHFLLFLDQPTSNITKYIDAKATTLNSSNSNTSDTVLTRKDSRFHNLTPLMLAALKGDEPVVDSLIKANVVKLYINDADENGWTALHFAAITSSNIYSKLKTAGAKEELRSIAGLTPVDARNYTSLDVVSSAMGQIYFEDKPLTKDRIAQFGMTHFRDDMYYPPSEWRELWQQEKLSMPETNLRFISNSIEQPTKKMNIVALPAHGFGLTAGEKIPLGTVIGVYAGVFRKPLPPSHVDFSDLFKKEISENTAYYFDNSDATTIGSHLRFIQCGFPLLKPETVMHRGSKKTIYVALKDINPGEHLCVDYGPQYYSLTFGPQCLYGSEEMSEFFKQGLHKISEKIEQPFSMPRFKEGELLTKNYSHFPERWEKERYITQLRFPLNNPLAMFHLHYSGIVSLNSWNNFLYFSHNSHVAKWREMYVNADFYLSYLLDRTIEYDALLQAKHPTISKTYSEWMLANLEKICLMNLFVVAAVANKHGEGFTTEITERLKNYNWETDDYNPYSYNNLKARRDFLFDMITEAQMPAIFSLEPQKNDPSFLAKKKAFIENELQIAKQLKGFEGSKAHRMFQELLDETNAASAKK